MDTSLRSDKLITQICNRNLHIDDGHIFDSMSTSKQTVHDKTFEIKYPIDAVAAAACPVVSK